MTGGAELISSCKLFHSFTRTTRASLLRGGPNASGDGNIWKRDGDASAAMRDALSLRHV